VAALMHAEEAFAPLHQHVTIITLTLDFNKDVGGGWCGQQRRRRQTQGSDRLIRICDEQICCILFCFELISFLLLCYPSVFRRFLVDC
jgi:hypothetical protein